MRRVYLTTLVTCLAAVLATALLFVLRRDKGPREFVTVGFVYEDDESTPYTYNFSLAAEDLQEELQDRVHIMTKSNVPVDGVEEPVREMVRKGCEIIFTSSNSDMIVELAAEFPDVQFCQISYLDQPLDKVPENYHTFKGELYQARYVSGVAAGMKLREMIDNGEIAPEKAVVGYLGAFPSAAIVSGYTAFLLGIRSVAPEAVMKVIYTDTWGNIAVEKEFTKKLIDEGCVIISHHSDTNGPAMACEEAAADHIIYFVGYNESMLDVAPTTALVSTRINWAPYVTGAVEAVLANRKIESYVPGHVHGNDMSAGFEYDWVQVLDLNTHEAAEGTEEKMLETIQALEKGKLRVFEGDYIGVSYEDESDVLDLKEGFRENRESSSPSFRYVLQDYVTVL